MKLQLALQHDTIELPLVAKDSAKKTDTFRIGFKRYPVDESQEKLEAILAILDITKEDEDSKSDDSAEAKLARKQRAAEQKAALDAYFADEIDYIAGFKCDAVGENGATRTIKVDDSRKVKAEPGLWATPEECLSVLVDSILASSPYRSQLLDLAFKAIGNIPYEED